MEINRFNLSAFNLAGRQEPVESGLFLQTPPPFAQNTAKPFGKKLFGEIVEDAEYISSKSREDTRNQKENANDRREQLAYTSAYANSVSAYGNSVREQVRASATEQGIARANMIDLNQPMTQQQFLALNKKLDTIGGKLDQLNSLLGDKSTNTEAWNLKKSLFADNPHGNSELDVA